MIGLLRLLKHLMIKESKYYKNKRNIGQTKSLNIGIKKSSGKYIARIDADDLFEPNKLYEQFKYMESHPEIAACGTGSIKINHEGEKVGLRIPPIAHEEIVSTMLYRSPMIHVSILIRKDCIIGGYDENFPICADYDLWSRLVIENFKLANLPSTLTSHRLLQDSVGNLDFLGSSVNEVAEIIHNYWLKTTSIPITSDDCRHIALMRRPDSGLSLEKICETYKLIASARKKVNSNWSYLDTISIDMYKLLLWSITKNNNYKRDKWNTTLILKNNLSLLIKMLITQ